MRVTSVFRPVQAVLRKPLQDPVPGTAVLRNGSTWGTMNPRWREGSAVYTSAALSGDFVTYGPANADLWPSSESSPDADLAATITVVHADGQEQYVQRGRLRLSNRALDEQQSKPGSPVLLDAPGDTGTYTFSYNPVSTTLKIWHDPEHSSKLVLNELAGESVPASFAASAYTESFSQPCRPDPLAANRQR